MRLTLTPLPNLSCFNQRPEVQAALAPYSLKFAHCILPILYLEGGLRADGGLNDVASDRGGLTKYGVSQRAYPTVDIKNLTIAHAIRLYHRDYWRAMYCEQLDDGVDLLTLDGAINHGSFAMSQVLQRASGAKADGRIGPNTLKAVSSCAPQSLVARLSVNRGRKYARICVNDASQKPNLEGWFNRLTHISEYAFAELWGQHG